MQQSTRVVGILTSLLLVVATVGSLGANPGLTPEQALGKALYADTDLSLNRNQSCQSCHHPAAGFADPKNAANPFQSPVSEGSVPGMVGGRNSPTAAYAAFSPPFAWDAAGRQYRGGQFWDGRAKTLEEQAAGPPMNPAEMAMPSKELVRERFAANPEYVRAFTDVYGLDVATASAEAVFAAMGKAIAAYEATSEVCPFSSKFDAFLVGTVRLNCLEMMGLRLFTGPAGCSNCHAVEYTRSPDGTVVPPLLTNFTYHNVGAPKNVNLDAARTGPPDYGLGGVADIAAVDPQGLERGKFKVPTLRNVARTAPYGHNGVFRTLGEIVHFYSTRDLLPTCPDNATSEVGSPCWRAPEVAQNRNTTDMGRLRLSPMQETCIVAFLQTLTDGWPQAAHDRGGEDLR